MLTLKTRNNYAEIKHLSPNQTIIFKIHFNFPIKTTTTSVEITSTEPSITLYFFTPENKTETITKIINMLKEI